jgi:hypothetical protein
VGELVGKEKKKLTAKNFEISTLHFNNLHPATPRSPASSEFPPHSSQPHLTSVKMADEVYDGAIGIDLGTS